MEWKNTLLSPAAGSEGGQWGKLAQPCPGLYRGPQQGGDCWLVASYSHAQRCLAKKLYTYILF